MNAILLTSALLYARDYPEETNPDPHLEDITLTFAWPAGLKCHVEAHEDRTGRGAGLDLSWTEDRTFGVVAYPDGLVIHTESATIELSGPPAPSPLAAVEASLRKMAQNGPDVLISPSGSFKRITNFETWRDRLLGGFNDLTADLPEQMRAKLKGDWLERIASSPVSRTELDRWTRGPGYWPGITMTPGAAAMVITTSSSPFLPEQPYRVLITNKIQGAVPCAAEATESTCVKLEYSALGMKTDLTPAIQANLHTLFGSDAPMVVAEASATTHSVLIAEPNTLIPHSERVEHFFHLDAVDAAGVHHTLDLGQQRTETTTCTSGG